MKRLPIRFSLLLAFIMAIVFFSHYFMLGHLGLPPLADMVLVSYMVNYLMAVSIFVGLYSARKRLRNALGFLFMGGSLIKFIVFFIIFYPVYRADGEMQKTEFAAFFVPYLTALVLETYFASKMLNQVADS